MDAAPPERSTTSPIDRAIEEAVHTAQHYLRRTHLNSRISDLQGRIATLQTLTHRLSHARVQLEAAQETALRSLHDVLPAATRKLITEQPNRLPSELFAAITADPSRWQLSPPLPKGFQGALRNAASHIETWERAAKTLAHAEQQTYRYDPSLSVLQGRSLDLKLQSSLNALHEETANHRAVLSTMEPSPSTTDMEAQLQRLSPDQRRQMQDRVPGMTPLLQSVTQRESQTPGLPLQNPRPR